MAAIIVAWVLCNKRGRPGYTSAIGSKRKRASAETYTGDNGSVWAEQHLKSLNGPWKTALNGGGIAVKCSGHRACAGENSTRTPPPAIDTQIPSHASRETLEGFDSSRFFFPSFFSFCLFLFFLLSCFPPWSAQETAKSYGG